MSTRSSIILKTSKGYESVYCHWNGHPYHNGRLLLESFNTRAKVKELLSLGDISSLKSNIDPGGVPHSFDSPAEGVTVFYGRDRGEEGCKARVSKTLELGNSWEEFIYLYKTGKWYFTPVKESTSLKDFKILTPEDCK